ncbi:hypothetical protein IC762_18135 [Bradyrhizobium genosp. L]|uniref:hypothetical protein n=1 Tax=Bradyrhizobium genosp. L TaxID=83637 RepID=UPI0018A2F294|nr:hypothetical protein [Bradyrhizobium genosp. L]QPF81739.1 hypothetical protein IC762_18135 [Bradyrhizobium genosp. L]
MGSSGVRLFATAMTRREDRQAGKFTNKTQNRHVNPLTRLVSRYVMRRNYQSPHVEGPAATFDPGIDVRSLPDRFAVMLPVRSAVSAEGIIGVGP